MQTINEMLYYAQLYSNARVGFFSWNEPDNKWFQISWPHSVCCNYSTLPLQCESSHRQYIKDWGGCILTDFISKNTQVNEFDSQSTLYQCLFEWTWLDPWHTIYWCNKIMKRLFSFKKILSIIHTEDMIKFNYVDCSKLFSWHNSSRIQVTKYRVGQKEVHSCEYEKHRVYSYYYLLFYYFSIKQLYTYFFPTLYLSHTLCCMMQGGKGQKNIYWYENHPSKLLWVC